MITSKYITRFCIKKILPVFFILPVLYINAQSSAYPQNYFRNPLAIPMQLSANFGELRPDHWHMGLDIRTNQKENYPVYAAAEGFIAHIGIRPQSFGRFIIIEHPNGLSTLYAHLNDFFPALEQYVTAQQYRQETWAIELDFTKNQFPVNKGKFIAFSGNTGGSNGPHLHFEIFNTKTTKRLNPLLFNFPVTDSMPPTLVKLAVYDRSKSVYEQSPQIFFLTNTDSGYIIPATPVLKTGFNKISFALQAYDKMNKRGSADGIYSAMMYVDKELLTGFVLDSIDYDETVYVNAQADYKYKYDGGVYLQHLSKMPGDPGAVYKTNESDGILRLTDTNTHAVTIVVKDAIGNTSNLNFFIQHSDSLAVWNYTTSTLSKFIPNQANVLKKPGFEMYLPENCLYDTVSVTYFRDNFLSPYAVSALHQVNDGEIPAHTDVTVRILPAKDIPDEWKDKIVIQRSSRKSKTIQKARWDNGWLTATCGGFGSFQALMDTLPPAINELGKEDTVDLSKATRIVFTPSDNLGTVRKFRAESDGQWLRFTNNKSRNWIYTFDEHCPDGLHELKVTIEDEAGNTTVKKWWFRRNRYLPPKKKSAKKS